MVHSFEATVTSSMKGNLIPKLNTKGNSAYVLLRLNSTQRHSELPEDMATALVNGTSTKNIPPKNQQLIFIRQLRPHFRHDTRVSPPKNGVQYRPEEAIKEYKGCASSLKR